MNRNRSNSRGFTLVEVLAASSIICVFATSFVYLAAAGIKQISASKQLTRSVLISKSVMEELRSKDFSTLLSYNNVSFDNGAGRITVVPAGSDRLLITVKDKVELNTMRSRY